MIKKTRKGEPITTRPLNDVIDRVNRRKLNQGKPFAGIRQSGTIALAVNQTGEDLPFGSIAAYDLELPIPAGFEESPTKLESLGTTIILREPGADDLHNFVVTASAIPDEQSGPVYTEGVILARLNEVEGSGDDQSIYCDADPDTYTNGGNPFVLSKRYDGHARIIKTIGETEEPGILWALIQYPIWNDSFARYAIATSSPDADGVLTVKLADSEGNEVGEDITVWDGGQ